jgi:ribokinase
VPVTGPVVVVGSINLDTTLEVQRLPASGETVMAEIARTGVGGKGANQAVAAARQGAATVFVGLVGADAAGGALRDALVEEGVDVDACRVAPEAASGQALITVDAGGANTIVVAAGANGLVKEDDIELAPQAAVVLTQLEIPLPAVWAAMARGRATGATTVLNPAPAPGPLDSGLLQLCDVIVPNEHEALALTGATSPSVAAAELGARSDGATVIVTLGERGAIVWRNGRETMVPAFPVQAVDTVAAGDGFCGTLAASLAEGASMEDAVRRASAAGALAATERGALRSLPTRQQVDELLERHPG